MKCMRKNMERRIRGLEEMKKDQDGKDAKENGKHKNQIEIQMES